MFSELLSHCKETMMVLTVQVTIVLLEMFSKTKNSMINKSINSGSNAN